MKINFILVNFKILWCTKMEIFDFSWDSPEYGIFVWNLIMAISTKNLRYDPTKKPYYLFMFSESLIEYPFMPFLTIA